MIKNQARVGSRILIALVALAVFTAAYAIMEIRFGGPIQRKHTLNDEMLADILPPPAFVVEPFLEASLAAGNPANAAKNLKRIAEIHEEFEARKAYWATAPVPPEMRDQLNTTIAVAETFFTAVNEQLAPAIAANDRDQAIRVVEHSLAPIYRRQHGEVTRLVGMSRDFAAAEMQSDTWMVGILLGCSALAALLVAGAMLAAARLIDRRIIAPLDDANATFELLSAGHTDVEISGLSRQDEFGALARAMDAFRNARIAREQARQEQERVVRQLSIGLDKLATKDLEHRIEEPFPESYEGLRRNFNDALEAIAKAMGIVRVGSSSVMNAISEIRAAADDLAQRNQQQAASLEETSAAMRQVTGQVSDSAANTVVAQDAINDAQQQATEGGDVVRQAVEAMAAIEGSAQEIASIIDVIDGIAFQTNLLALNAGVEAARAGDAGKGFAVVATEVRALAQRSAEAAQNIKELITKSSTQVETGVALVGQTGNKLSEIVNRIGDLHGLISAIATSAGEQAESLRQVGCAVNDMDRMTQQNAAMVEETTAATRSLETEALALSRMMATFRTRVRASRPDIPGDTDRLRRSSAAAAVPGLMLGIEKAA